MTNLYEDIIGLITDFGPRGQHYVASMKAIILKLNTNIKIIDISHNISSYSIIEASYLIKTTYRYFPENTVFIIVVDPGVGSSREILALKTISNYYFIGPNNGIFSNIISNDEIEECVVVENENYFNKPVSETFHGRDIMAPVGAHIINGIPLSNFGSQFNPKNFINYSLEFEVKPKKKIIRCVVQYIDSFGNGTTNIPIENNSIIGTSLSLTKGGIIKFKFNNKEYEGKFTSHFADVPKNSLLFLKGSSNFLEISKNQGNAAKDIGFKVGDIITVMI